MVNNARGTYMFPIENRDKYKAYIRFTPIIKNGPTYQTRASASETQSSSDNVSSAREGFIEKTYTIGKKDSKLPVWEILDKNKNIHSYIFETYDYAQIPGFSGGKMNLLVQIDVRGNFLDIVVLEQDEPVFNAGVGIEPFIEFLKQYRKKMKMLKLYFQDIKALIKIITLLWLHN